MLKSNHCQWHPLWKLKTTIASKLPLTRIMASSINGNDSASNNSTINDVPTTPWNRQEWMFPSYIQPVHILFGSAVPLCLGAYFGFTRQIRIYKKEAAAEAAAEAMNAVSNVVTTEGKILAGRALTIATMSSVGGFALTGAGTFTLTTIFLVSFIATIELFW